MHARGAVCVFLPGGIGSLESGGTVGCIILRRFLQRRVGDELAGGPVTCQQIEHECHPLLVELAPVLVVLDPGAAEGVEVPVDAFLHGIALGIRLRLKPCCAVGRGEYRGQAQLLHVTGKKNIQRTLVLSQRLLVALRLRVAQGLQRVNRKVGQRGVGRGSCLHISIERGINRLKL